MTDFESAFQQIVKETSGAVEGKMFGALCIKVESGKTAAFFWKDNMVFKLDEASQQQAFKLEGASIGAHIYAPERKMKGWVAIPSNHSELWAEYAKKAVEFVSGLQLSNCEDCGTN